ncbi:MAG: class I SAM-dependent methyltransferase [Desulfatirhabdiaceae bacterium]
MDPDVFLQSFWHEIWETTRSQSILQQTQSNAPDRWQSFYNTVSDIWQVMTGDGKSLSRTAAGLLIREGVVRTGDSVLDIGCGPGALALAFAENGILTTALDSSPAMLSRMMAEATGHGLTGIVPVHSDWCDYRPTVFFDLVIAAFFPPAMSPSGINRMESLSSGFCAMIVGTGNESFPIRKKLWKRLIQTPIPHPGRHLICAINYLMTSNRNPNVNHFSLPVSIKPPIETIRRYYQRYFSIFGIDELRVKDALETELTGFLQTDDGSLPGQMDAALIWWKARDGRRRDDKEQETADR